MDFNFVDINSKQSEADGGDDDDDRDHFDERSAMAVDPLSTDNPLSNDNPEIKEEYEELILKCEPIDYDNEDDEDARDESRSDDGASILPENNDSRSSIQSSVGNCLEMDTGNSLEVEKSDNRSAEKLSSNPKTCVVMGNQLCQVIPENSASTAFRIVPNLTLNGPNELSNLLYPSLVSKAPNTSQSIAPKDPVNSSALKFSLAGSSKLIKIQENMYLVVQPIGLAPNVGPQGAASNQLSPIIAQVQSSNQSPNVLAKLNAPGLITQKPGLSSNEASTILGQTQPVGATTSQTSNLQSPVVSSNEPVLGLPQTSGLTSDLALNNSSILGILLTKQQSPAKTAASTSVSSNQDEKQKSLPIQTPNQLPNLVLTHEQSKPKGSASNVSNPQISGSNVNLSLGDNVSQPSNSNKFGALSINGSNILVPNPMLQSQKLNLDSKPVASPAANLSLNSSQNKPATKPVTLNRNLLAVNANASTVSNSIPKTTTTRTLVPISGTDASECFARTGLVSKNNDLNVNLFCKERNAPVSDQSLSKSISDQTHQSMVADPKTPSNSTTHSSQALDGSIKYGLVSINGTHVFLANPLPTASHPQVAIQSSKVGSSTVSSTNNSFLSAKSASPGQSNNALNAPFVILNRSQPQQTGLLVKNQSIKQQTPLIVSPTKDCTLVKPTDKDSGYILPTVDPLCSDQLTEGNRSPNQQSSQPVISFIRYGSDALESMDVEDQKLLLSSTKLLEDRVATGNDLALSKNDGEKLSSGDLDKKSSESSDEIRIEMESSLDLVCEDGDDEDFLEPENNVDPLADTDPIFLEPEVIFDDNDGDDEEEEEEPRKKVKKSKKEVLDSESAESCPICKQLVNNLENHIREKHQFVCGICDKVFNRKPNLITHLAVHSDKRDYACKLCDKTYKSKAGLYVHERTHDLKKRPTCEYCGKSFLLISHLQVHLYKQHADVAKKFVCDTCGEEFVLKRLWMVHKNRHKEEGILCMVCGRRFTSNEELKAHSSVHTKQDLVHDFCCDLCGRTFRELHFLTAHRQAHARRQYICITCQKAFTTQEDLDKHWLARHQYKCKKCGSQFRNEDSLKVHRKVHYKRKFECSVCQLRFQSPDEVQVHIDAVHLKKKVFECDICDKAFSRKHSLKTHKVMHTADYMQSLPNYRRGMSKGGNNLQIKPASSGVS